MSLLGDRLGEHWKAHGVDFPPGVDYATLRKFEERFGISLPTDMRDYFLFIDGMGSRDESDDDWFCFWPLAQVVRASDEYDETFIEEEGSYFLFADHSICLPAYAIRLSASETATQPVIAIYSGDRRSETSLVARSFREFVERYLRDGDSRAELSVGCPVE